METVVIYPPKKDFGKLIIGLLGLGLSVVALFLFLLPIFKKEVSYRIKKAFAHQSVVANGEENEGLRIKMSLAGGKPDEEKTSSSKVKEFRLVIPKIDVDVPVFANIDPNDEQTYKEILTKGVAHAKDTHLPGQLGSSFIFGHSTDFPWNVGWMNAVFYLLKELEKGDKVYVFYNDKRLEYLVTEKRIVEPEEVALLKSRLSEERLILQTCWPPGTRLKRLLVICHPKSHSIDK